MGTKLKMAVFLAIFTLICLGSGAQSAEQTEITVVGRVTDEARQPIAGAEVSVYPYPSVIIRADQMRAQTDEQGNYTLPGIPANTERLSFRVEHPDFLSIRHQLTLETLKPGEVRQDFVLRAGGKVTGQVTSPDGPLLGVRIRSRSLDSSQPSQSTTTNTEGRYILHLAEGEHTVLADHPDYAIASVKVSLKVGEVTVADLALTAGMIISGKVINEAGNPVRGVSVSAFNRGVGSRRQARTDRKGLFEIWGLAEGEIRISAWHRSYARLNGIKAMAGATDLELVLQNANILTGHVVDAESGQPVRSFEVYMAHPNRYPEFSRATQVTRLPGGRFQTTQSFAMGTKYDVVVSAPGYMWSLIEGVMVDSLKDKEGLEIVLSRGAALKGRVVSEDGQPVAKAKVQEMMPGIRTVYSSRVPFLEEGRTDETGIFIFKGVSPDGIDVWISHPDFVDVKRKAVPSGLEAPVEFQMERGLAITGQVFQAGGPAEGVQVTASLKERRDRLVRRTPATTDADGRYSLEHLPPGPYRVLLIKGERTKQMQVQSRDVELVDQDVTLDFEPLGEGKIHGVVILDGKPVAGAQVMAYIGGEDLKDRMPVGRAVTDADGRYELIELPADRIYLNVYKRDLTLTESRDKRISAVDEVDLRKASDVEHQIELKVEYRVILKVGDPAPDFTSTLLDGSTIRLSDYRGKVVLLDFWATWCGPCKKVMPIMEELANEYKDKGVVLIAVDLRESPQTIRSFLQEQGLHPTVALDKDGTIANSYGAKAIPQTVIIGKDGTVQAVHVGSIPNLKEILKKELDDLLAGKKLVPASTPVTLVPSRSLSLEKAEAVWQLQAEFACEDLSMSRENRSKVIAAFVAARRDLREKAEKLRGDDSSGWPLSLRDLSQKELDKFKAVLEGILEKEQSGKAIVSLGAFITSRAGRWDQMVETVKDFELDKEKMRQAVKLVCEYIIDYEKEIEELSWTRDGRSFMSSARKLREELDSGLAKILNDEQFTKWKEATTFRRR